MSRKGFTLIELLVVIAIIAILAAILFPVFAQAREKARAISCLSNNKQIGTAVQMYVQDYDETFPFAGWRDDGTPHQAIMPDGRTYKGYVTWEFQLFPYVKNKQVFTCASDADPNMGLNKDTTSNPLEDWWGKVWPGSMGINSDLTWPPYNRPQVPVTLASVNFPADTYFLADIVSDQPVGFGSFADDGGTKGPGLYKFNTFNRVRSSKGHGCAVEEEAGGLVRFKPNSDSSICARHMGGNNFVFTDSHAKFERNSDKQDKKTDPIRDTQ